jgi:phosphate transport system substrate-binding protein
MLKHTKIFFFIYILSFLGCKNTDPKDIEGRVTVGSTEIWCDNNLKKIIEQEKEIFLASYKYTDIKINYAPETIIKKKFYKDSLDVIIISSKIDTSDLIKFNSKKVFPRQYKLGSSAIAFITSKESRKDTFSKNEIIKELINDNSDYQFIIEDLNSGIANQLLEVTGKEKLSKKVFAKNSKTEVINWINKNPKSIGIIDWSELSDSDDNDAQKILSNIKLIGISTENSKGEFLKPYQYNLNGDYPFTRDIYLIRRLGKPDVSLGFASFICSERGQKILLKAGLLPEYQTERWIELKPSSDINIVK